MIIFNPLLFSTVFTILFLLIFQIDYDVYYENADCLYYILTPLPVCLSIPLYEQLHRLKKNIMAIFIGILSGVVACLTSVLCLVIIVSMDTHRCYSAAKIYNRCNGYGCIRRIGRYS